MKPVIKLLYKYDYAKNLYRGQGNFEDVWRRIISIGRDFEKVYYEYIEYVFSHIEKFTGFSWDEYAEDNFPIYLAEVEQSFAHPLTLAVNDDPEKMLEDLIYQLAHRNMHFGFASEELQEKSIRLTTDYVLGALNIKDINKTDWDLDQHTIKYYLKK